MRKLFAFALVSAAFVWGSYTPAGAVSGITICHYNGDGTWAARALTFASSDDALRLAEHTATAIVYHINDTTTDNASDIWPGFTWDQSQYTQAYVPASKNWTVYTYTSWYQTVNRVRKLVHGWLWLPNPVTQHIFFNGCKT